MLRLPATPKTLLRDVIVPGLALLPPTFDSARARGLLVAIAPQESGLRVRRQGAQVAGGALGPARGLWQFEEVGVRGVLQHDATADIADMVLRRAKWPTTAREVHRRLELPESDLIACVLARLNLFTDPRPLPGLRIDEQAVAYGYYKRVWRPGAANTPAGDAECRKRWAPHWKAAVELCA